MSIYEYDEKLHEKTMMEIGRKEAQDGISPVLCFFHFNSYFAFPYTYLAQIGPTTRLPFLS